MAHDSPDCSVLDLFHSIVAEWFRSRFDRPTRPQAEGWPSIARGLDTLITAPTGSGKTLSAFLTCIDRLVRSGLEGTLGERTHVVYVSPLKALSHDIHRDLQVPLAEIKALAEVRGTAGKLPFPDIRVAVRTGDTTSSARQAMLRKPPHLLVTTPESLYLLLTAPRSRNILKSVTTVIVDEIHALARNKRGTHRSLSLERLERVAWFLAEPIRIVQIRDIQRGSTEAPGPDFPTEVRARAVERARSSQGARLGANVYARP